MPATKCFAMVRGSVIRVTAVDACGLPLPGASAVAVSKRVSSVAFTEVSEDGTNIRDRNFADELCIVDDATADLIGYGVEATLCGVDPDLISLFTGVSVVKNASGDTVGFDTDTTIDLDSFGFAIEVWSRISGVACNPQGARPWGYTVAPFVKGGRIGDFSFENAAVTFSITGAQTRDGNGWGVGPFNVDLGLGSKEVQTITITGTPTGGSYTLTFGGQATSAIAYNATSTVVAAALNALPSVTAAGGVTATGGPHPGTPVVVSFGTNGDVAAMTATGSLTGGSTPSVNITTTTAGAAGVASPLYTPLKTTTPFRTQMVYLDPPTPTCGAVPLVAA